MTCNWNTQLFELVEYGIEDIGIYEQWRRLFWVRLRLKADGRTLLVANAHFTWQGHPRIQSEGTKPRLDQARRTVEALNKVAQEGEPVLFMGDLNESGEAIDILRAGGFKDSFGSRGLAVPYTHPADPSQSRTNTT